MMDAVTAVRKKEMMGYKRASKVFAVLRSTLKDYVKRSSSSDSKEIHKIGRPTVLTSKLEELLVQYCLQMERNFYGLTSKDLTRMAYQLAIRNNLSHPFSAEVKSAGRKWKRLFLKRHPILTIRKPENLSMVRIQGFSKENVNTFFTILKSELEKINFDATRIFNVDGNFNRSA